MSLAALARWVASMTAQQWPAVWPVITRLTLTELIRKKMSTAVQRNVVLGVSQSRATSCRNLVQ